MLRNIFCCLVAFFYLLTTTAQEHNNTNYVNPFIGTDGSGHTFPGATLPFSLVQASPETGFVGWEHCSGYHYADKRMYGFSQTHLSGTGAKDLGDILVLPYKGIYHDTLSSAFYHSQEKASPGYYKVVLSDFDIKTEITATQRTAFYRISNLQPGRDIKIAVNLKSGLVNSFADLETHVIESSLNQVDNYTLQGHRITKGWAGIKHVYFVIKFQLPCQQRMWLSDSASGRNQIMAFDFSSDNLLMKIGISTVSMENALDNLNTENPYWNFDLIKQRATQVWNRYLSTINIDGSRDQKTIFYTALYHALIAPNNIADCNGAYRGADNGVYYSKQKAYYSTLSLWDTYRAQNPLLTILAPDKVYNIVGSMIAHYKVQGFLPIWSLWGHENYCMIGNHAIPVIADACLKKIYPLNDADVLESVLESSLKDHKGSEWSTYLKYGYYPSDIIRKEAVSKTLESCFDDWCVAQILKSLYKDSLYEVFNNRASFYRKLFDSSSGFMRGKKSDGSWDDKFDPMAISHAGTTGGNYTEGNAWQYTWSVQHDPEGLVALFGGKVAFNQRLDSLFKLPSIATGEGSTLDVTGLIGQYAQGNEPCHHVPYLFSLTGQPWKTSDIVSRICDTFYKNTPDGLCGNDDCGQMSAWYIFSAMGFYPLNPASGQYVFGKPLYKKVQVNVGKNPLVITARNLNRQNPYIQKIYWNGKRYFKPYLTHSALMQGGSLVFVMGAKRVDYSSVNF